MVSMSNHFESCEALIKQAVWREVAEFLSLKSFVKSNQKTNKQKTGSLQTQSDWFYS